MALIKLGAVVAEISGSIDGVTFSHSRTGRYARVRVKPTNPRSVKQTAVRSQLASLSQQWRTLTSAQRTAWASLGSQMTQVNRLGATNTLTGQQAFISINQLNITAGLAVVTAAPTLDSAPTVTPTNAVVTFTTAGGTTSASATWTSNGSATQKIRIYATGPMSAGKSFVRNSQFRFMKSVAANTASLTFSAEYNAAFGGLSAGAAGARVAFRLVPVSANGIPGTPIRIDALVTVV